MTSNSRTCPACGGHGRIFPDGDAAAKLSPEELRIAEKYGLSPTEYLEGKSSKDSSWSAPLKAELGDNPSEEIDLDPERHLSKEQLRTARKMRMTPKQYLQQLINAGKIELPDSDDEDLDGLIL